MATQEKDKGREAGFPGRITDMILFSHYLQIFVVVLNYSTQNGT